MSAVRSLHGPKIPYTCRLQSKDQQQPMLGKQQRQAQAAAGRRHYNLATPAMEISMMLRPHHANPQTP